MRSRRHSRQTGPVYRATSDPPPLRRTAAVVRNRRHVLDTDDFDPGALDRADRGLASGTRTLHLHVDLAHAVFHRPARHGLRCELRSERRRLARPLEAHVAGRRPGDRVPLLIGDADDRVVEGRLDVRNPVRDVLALTPLGPSSAGGRLRHAGLLAVSSRCWFGSVLAGPLLPGNGLAGTLAGTGVGPGALAVHRQPTTVAQSLVAADLDLALDVGGDLAAEVTLDLQVLVDVRADTSD